MAENTKQKLMAIDEGAAFVQSGMTIGFGGLTIYRRPVSFARALLRQAPRPQDLTLLSFTAGIESDLLIGAGMVNTSRTCYFGLESFGLAPMFTEYSNHGRLTIIEETEASIVAGFRATLSGVGFMPSRAWIGTDLPKLRPDVLTIKDPYSDDLFTAFPALKLDVAIIHALVADKQGNSRLNGNMGVDPELAMVADTVIITAEEIVDELHEDIDIPSIIVQAVVHAPQGAYPTSCYPLYPLGGEELLHYVELCQADRFADYVAEILSEDWPQGNR